MRSAGVSPQKNSETAFAEGDEGEQIIANVLLAAMVSQLHSEAAVWLISSMHTRLPRAWRNDQVLIAPCSLPDSLG